ncbi:MAG: flippase [Dehalococcoidia bacterium]|jgi:O-antigen/teichoic acid export membrane protein
MSDMRLEGYTEYARDVGFVVMAQVLVALLNFARLPILTKWLGASLYGTWSIIWVTITLITSVASLGLGMAMVRFIAAERDRSKISEAYLSIMLTIMASGISLSLLLALFVSFSDLPVLGDINNSNTIVLASFMVLTQALGNISIAYFRTFRQMLRYAIFMVVRAAGQVGLMLCFMLAGWQLTGAVIAVLISDVLCFTAAFIITLKQTGFQFPKFTGIWTYLRYGLPLVPATVTLWIINSSDRYIIGYFMDVKNVGIYSAIYTIANIISLFLGPANALLLPTVSKSYDDGDTASTKNYFKFTLKYTLLLSVPAAFGMSVLAAPLIRILTSTEFMSGSTVLPFIASGLVIFELYSIGNHIFYLVKKTHWILWLLIITAVLNVALTLLLVPLWGIIGAGIASLIAYAVTGILTIIIGFRYFKFDLSYSFIVKSIFASVVMSLVIWLLHPYSILQVIMAIIIGAFIYLILIWLMRSFSRNELSLFKDVASRFIIGKQQ